MNTFATPEDIFETISSVLENLREIVINTLLYLLTSGYDQGEVAKLSMILIALVFSYYGVISVIIWIVDWFDDRLNQPMITEYYAVDAESPGHVTRVIGVGLTCVILALRLSHGLHSYRPRKNNYHT